MGEEQRIQNQQVTVTNSMPAQTPATMAGHSFAPGQEGGAPLSNAEHTGNRQIEGIAVEAEQQATLLSLDAQKAKVSELLKKYSSDIQFDNDETDGGYKLTFKNENISNEKIQEILSSLDGIAISHLDLINLKNMTEFNSEGLENVRALQLINCPELQNFEAKGLSNLIQLMLFKCPQITSFNGDGLASLNLLSIIKCGLTEFNGEGLGALTNLLLYECPQMESFNGDGLANLKLLSIIKCGLTEFNGEGLGALTNLTLDECPQLQSFNGDVLTKLQNLEIHNCGLTGFNG